MIIKYTDIEFKNAESRDNLRLECKNCHKEFYRTKHVIQKALNLNQAILGCKNDFCSRKCDLANRINKKSKTVSCKECNKSFKKFDNQIKKSPNHFCSKPCAGTYNAKNKTYGIRRSKLEIWLESKLTEKYPDLEFHFNRKDTIKSELDIYIPSLKLAFELNGIFHYEPIYGQDKLDSIKNNDGRKFQACLESDIELCLIDVSLMKNFKENNAVKYFNIIENIISRKKLHSQGESNSCFFFEKEIS